MPVMLEMSETEYRAHPAVNYSVLKHAQKSAAHMKHARDTVTEPTPQMVLGTVVDCLLFSRNDFTKRFVVSPDIDRRTKEGKAAYQELLNTSVGKTIISADVWQKADAMVSSALKSKAVLALLADQRFQVPMLWHDADTGVECKALCDSIRDGVTVTDCKTTHNADWREFSRSCANFSYHVQAAFYTDGYFACTKQRLPYTFIAIESAAPYPVAVYRLDNASIEAGRRQYKYALEVWKRSTASGVWEGYPDQLQTIELPKYALTAVGVEADDPF